MSEEQDNSTQQAIDKKYQTFVTLQKWQRFIDEYRDALLTDVDEFRSQIFRRSKEMERVIFGMLEGGLFQEPSEEQDQATRQKLLELKEKYEKERVAKSQKKQSSIFEMSREPLSEEQEQKLLEMMKKYEKVLEMMKKYEEESPKET